MTKMMAVSVIVAAKWMNVLNKTARMIIARYAIVG